MRKTIHCHNLDGTTIYQTIQVDDGHKWNGHKVWVDENGNRSYVLRKNGSYFEAWEVPFEDLK